MLLVKNEDISASELQKSIKSLNHEVSVSDLNEFEKVSLSYILETSVYIIHEAYDSQIGIINGRLECETNWRAVARGAITGGVAAGVNHGIMGLKAGVAATALTNPIVGGVVGGIAGFTVGFVYGSIVGGVAAYVAGQVFCDESVNPQINGYQYCLDAFCNERSMSSVGLTAGFGNSSYSFFFYTHLLDFE